MKKILLVAGTGDSTAFLKKVPADLAVLATTVSSLGAGCVPVRDHIKVHTGALDEGGFRELLQRESCEALVDMSHPFAVAVSAAAKAAAADCGLPYLRYQRRGYDGEHGLCRRFDSAAAAAAALNEVAGNILLTTGSKTLPVFKEIVTGFSERCYMRVLASGNILHELEDLGIDMGHVFAMKGVASKELNIALAREVGAACIVSKESGLTGGLKEKCEAAKDLGIPVFLITAPTEEGTIYHDFDSILSFLTCGEEMR